jgi:hypothetical protein
METDERSICTHVPQPQPSGVSHDPHDPEASPAQEAAASVRAFGKKTFRPALRTPSQDVNWLLMSGVRNPDFFPARVLNPDLARGA